MKRLFASILLLSALCMSASAQKNLRVLYWNIQNGMWSDQGNNYDNFVKFVQDLDPDVCVWCEAESRYRTGTCVKMESCEEAYLPYNWDILARRYGHKYVCISGKRDTFPQVITSRYPVNCLERINGNGDDILVVHGAGVCQLELRGGKTINIVTVHTWPQKYAYLAEDRKASADEHGGDFFRVTEMRYICEQSIGKAGDLKGQMWMMLGDFNAVSRSDNFHYKFAESDTAFLVHDYVRDNTPYVDALERWTPGVFQHTTFSKKRIDFIYCTQNIYDKIKDVHVIRDGYPETYRLKDMHNFCSVSDHYPILMDLHF